MIAINTETIEAKNKKRNGKHADQARLHNSIRRILLRAFLHVSTVQVNLKLKSSVLIELQFACQANRNFSAKYLDGIGFLVLLLSQIVHCLGRGIRRHPQYIGKNKGGGDCKKDSQNNCYYYHQSTHLIPCIPPAWYSGTS